MRNIPRMFELYVHHVEAQTYDYSSANFFNEMVKKYLR